MAVTGIRLCKSTIRNRLKRTGLKSRHPCKKNDVGFQGRQYVMQFISRMSRIYCACIDAQGACPRYLLYSAKLIPQTHLCTCVFFSNNMGFSCNIVLSICTGHNISYIRNFI